MQSGLYVTLSAQAALERRLTTIAANVANQSTPGYRAEEVDFKTFVSRAGGTPVAYASPGGTYVSRRAGVPLKTDNPLDVAVQGDCWLALKAPTGTTVYTRDGRMQMQPGGELRSVNGYTVLDAGESPIAVDPLAGPVTIARDGMISQGGRQIGAVGLFRLDRNAPLQRYDNSSVVSEKPAAPVLDFTRNAIARGYIEGSNVNPIMEMAKLITVSRTFESISSAIEGSENSLKEAIKILGGRA
ncbi:MAG: flagellar basal-body rod protein FlgF [Beijerinckiaceae bacterium]|nr:flagellar basal-body rod protein FlgF [Beijerinckiaceae bacterium]